MNDRMSTSDIPQPRKMADEINRFYHRSCDIHHELIRQNKQLVLVRGLLSSFDECLLRFFAGILGLEVASYQVECSEVEAANATGAAGAQEREQQQDKGMCGVYSLHPQMQYVPPCEYVPPFMRGGWGGGARLPRHGWIGPTYAIVYKCAVLSVPRLLRACATVNF